jgi:hypothetical protein
LHFNGKDAAAMEGKRIQFGRAQGLLILALGFLLLAFQILYSLHLFPSGAMSSTGAIPGEVPAEHHAMDFVPGFLGTLTIATGCYFLLQDKSKTRRFDPPARTKSGFPM